MIGRVQYRPPAGSAAHANVAPAVWAQKAPEREWWKLARPAKVRRRAQLEQIERAASAKQRVLREEVAAGIVVRTVIWIDRRDVHAASRQLDLLGPFALRQSVFQLLLYRRLLLTTHHLI